MNIHIISRSCVQNPVNSIWMITGKQPNWASDIVFRWLKQEHLTLFYCSPKLSFLILSLTELHFIVSPSRLPACYWTQFIVYNVLIFDNRGTRTGLNEDDEQTSLSQCKHASHSLSFASLSLEARTIWTL